MRKNIKALLLVVLALVMTFSLIACGHVHTYESEWTTTETHHYQAATCKHDVKLAEGEHQFGAWVENADGTARTKTCRVCQYQVAETIQHTHTYASDWTTDNDNHWKASTCGHNVKDQLGAHQFDAGVENADGTATIYTCSTCQYQKSVALPPHECTFAGDWLTLTPATILAEGEEYRECTSDKCTLRETRTTEKIAVVSIAVTTQPTKTTYNAGATFDATGIVVTATGADNSTANVTPYVTYDKTTLAVGDTVVTVSYQDKTAVVEIVVQELNYVSATVTEALTTVEAGTLIQIEALFVGVADVGHGYQREVLLKDASNDNLISIQGMPDSYGTWPNVGYEKGDKVRLFATLLENKYVFSETDEANNETHNKKYLEFADANPANIAETVVSKNNLVNYSLDNVVTLEAWSDWQEFFNVNTVPMYSYIRIKGTICLNRFRGQDSNGNVTLYRPHMVYTGASSVSHIKPDGYRAVGFRENALVANIGSAWDNYFSGKTWENNVGPSLSSTQEVDIICVLTGINRYNYQVTVLEAKWLKVDASNADILEITTNQQIVMEMAEAYLRQGGQLEYDQYSSRRMTFATPEEATAQELARFDCSSYVTSVYSNAFGIDAIPTEYFQNTKNYTKYAREHEGMEGYADVVGYWEAMDYTTEEEQRAMLAQLKEILQPGDILVYRHASGVTWAPGYSEDSLRGHAILYMGNNMFSHSRGTDWHSSNAESGLRNRTDPENAQDRANASEWEDGTVQYLSGSDVLNIGTGTRMLFGERSDRVFNFSIIRPLERTVELPQLTEQMQKRLTVAGLSFEKLTSAGINSGVTRGQEITYTMEITNHYGNEHKDVAFNEVLPEGVTFVSSNFGAVANGNTVTGKFNVEGKEIVTLKWTVRVDNDAVAGSLLCNVTTINGLMMKDITNSVVGYTQEQLAAVAAKAREYATSGATFADPMDLARAIYKEAIGVDLFGTETAQSMLASLTTNYKDTGCHALNRASQYATLVAPNMYGGWHFYADFAGANEYIDNTNLIRSPREHNLTLGDVIVAQHPTSKVGAATEVIKTRVYIYVGNGELVAIDSATKTCELVQNGSEEWVKESSTYVQQHLLITLFAYQRFAVIRPGQVAI